MMKCLSRGAVGAMLMLSSIFLVLAGTAYAKRELTLVRQIGEPGANAGQLSLPRDVAINDTTGDVYVTEQKNKRVDRLSAAGSFIMMVGDEVNATKDSQVGATAAEKDICTAASGDVCGSGVEGTGPGQFNGPQGIEIEQSTGDFYVVDKNNHRIEKFSAGGQFLLSFGRDVNLTKDSEIGVTQAEKNVCTSASGDTCGPGVVGSEAGAFSTWVSLDSVIGIKEGASPTLYVGDKGRVQKFDSDGTQIGSIDIATSLGEGDVMALTVDSAGNLYLEYSSVTGVRKLNETGVEQGSELFDKGNASTAAIGVWSNGNVVVVDKEPQWHGAVYNAAGLVVSPSFGVGTITFGTGLALYEAPGDIEEIYVADGITGVVQVYRPVVLPTAVTGATAKITTSSAALKGEVNPEGLSSTSFFEYGIGGALSSKTPTLSDGAGNSNVPLEADLVGLKPNQKYEYRLLAHDENGDSAGETKEFETLPVAPEIGATSVISADSQGALIAGDVNPENAETEYYFEYGRCTPVKNCESATPVRHSAAFGDVSVVQSIRGLLSDSTYYYRLVAKSKPHTGGMLTSTGPEASFQTLPSPVPTVGGMSASDITTSGALLSGDVEAPVVSGRYAFELEVKGGYWTSVSHGDVTGGEGGTSVYTTLVGLEAGTEYRWRLSVTNGYVTTAGSIVSFRTVGIPSPFVTPQAVLLVPTPSFPNVKHRISAKPKKKKKQKKKRGKGKSARKRAVRGRKR